MTAVIIRVVLFLLFLVVVGEVLKRIRRSKAAPPQGVISLRDSVALSPNATFSALAVGSQIYLIATSNGAVTLIDKLPVQQIIHSDLKQRRINGLK